MNRYRFAIGQVVKITLEDRWVGEYDVQGTIISLGNVFYNGVPTYNVRTSSKEVLTEVSENKIVL